jgi:hypothetical protein
VALELVTVFPNQLISNLCRKILLTNFIAAAATGGLQGSLARLAPNLNSVKLGSRGGNLSHFRRIQYKRKDKDPRKVHNTQLMSRLYPKATRSEDGMASIARVYAHVNETKPQEYWDYENYSIEWR